jgi:hypothetical protein
MVMANNNELRLANQQIVEMKKKFPGFTVTRKPGNFNQLIFTGCLQPDATMPNFKVEIQYTPGTTPKAFQIDPPLTTTKHTYDDRSLCLYKVSERLWREGDSVADITVPLTALWLYFNEHYKASGVWFGREATHEPGTTKLNK